MLRASVEPPASEGTQKPSGIDMMQDYRLVLVGDSDIAFWPSELYPTIPSETSVPSPSSATSIRQRPPDLVSGHSGATLAEIIPHVRRASSVGGYTDDDSGTKSSNNIASSSSSLIVVACAGENDVGNGIPLEKSVKALTEFLDVVFGDKDTSNNNSNGGGKKHHVIFLGPKFEPWLDEDWDSKKQYSAMSRAFQRCCREYENGDGSSTSNATIDHEKQVHYVDCLTVFCGETAHIPGAVLAGRAKAENRFFASDGLHLSNEGYAVWKRVVEKVIQESILHNSTGNLQ
jgi:lysophospholipase L1-like esterase